MEIQYELNLKITGHSLQEIDDGLVQAAGARLQARHGGGLIPGMTIRPPQNNPPAGSVGPQTQPPQTLPSNPPPKVVAQDPAAAPTTAATTEKRKPGRPPAAKKTEELTPQAAAPTTETQVSSPAPASVPQQAKAPAPDTSSSAPGAGTSPIPSKEECIKALSEVNSKINIDKARECLALFGVPRVRDLKDDQHQPFIDACKAAIAAGPSANPPAA